MLTNCMRLWRQAHFVSQSSNTELLEIELKCSKFARGCGPKHVWTSKVLKNRQSQSTFESRVRFSGHKQAKRVCVCARACSSLRCIHLHMWCRPSGYRAKAPPQSLSSNSWNGRKPGHTGKVRPKFRIKKSVPDLCVFDRHILLLKKSHDQVVKGFLILWPGCRLIMPCNYVVPLLAEQQARPHQRRFLPTS